MALATQCPHCYTSFRVANDQLKLHAGMVRCGACKQTFNGIEHLLAPGESPRTPPLPQEAALVDAADLQLTPSSAAQQEINKEADRNIPQQNESVEEDIENQETTEAIKTEAEAAVSHASQTSNEQNPVDEPTSVTATNGANVPSENLHKDSDAHSKPDSIVAKAEHDNSNQEIANKLTTPETSNESLLAAPDSQVISPSRSEVPPEFADYLSSELEHDEVSVDPIENATRQTPTTNEEEPSQQELDDIALFQEKLASFAAMVETDAQVDQAPEPATDQKTAEHYSSQLELIKQDQDHRDQDQEQHLADGELTAVPDKEFANKTSLSSELDFELSDEEKSWQESVELNRVELETQAVVSATDEKSYSRHEPVFSDDTVLEDELEKDLETLLKAPPAVPEKIESRVPIAPQKTEPIIAEPVISTTDHVPTPDPVDDEQPDFMLRAERAHRYGKWQLAGLLLGSLILFVAATIQGVYLMRSSIAAQYPTMKPHLQKFCAQLGCDLKLPTQIEHIVVEGTELTTLSQEPHVLQLSASFRNKGSTVQTWPMLELVLKDSRNRAVLQRVFKPEEYLDNPTTIAKGFAGNSEQTVKLHFELTTTKAANYAVEVFYP